MRKILFTTVALTAISGAALAADLPSTKSAPVFAPAPAFSWTGFYLGADLGGVWGQGKWSTATGSGSVSPSSVLGGGFVGYNYQVNQFVLGLQGGIDGMGVKGANAAGFSLKEDYLGSIDGRLGLAFDRALIYAIGGVAFTDTKFGVGTASVNGNSTGWDIGGGIEYAFLPNWTVRAEYRYYDFGQTSYTQILNAVPNPTRRLTKADDVVRVGLAYKFGVAEAAPVVAKY